MVNMLTAVPNAATRGNHGAEAKRRRKDTPLLPGPLSLFDPFDVATRCDAGLPNTRKTPIGSATRSAANAMALGLAQSPLAPIT